MWNAHIGHTEIHAGILLQVLQELDESTGHFLVNKTCGMCPAGTLVVTSSQKIAGVNYTADLYRCQVKCGELFKKPHVIACNLIEMP